MSIKGWNNTPAVSTQQIRIVTVDPETARIEGVLKDGAIVQVSVRVTGAQFRWPLEGETWTIQRRGVNWELDEYVDDLTDDFSITDDLRQGETKIASDAIYDRHGKRIVAVDISTASVGEAVVRTSDGWTTDMIAGGGGATPHVFNQSLPANPWTISHGLGREPIGFTVLDNDGDEIGAAVRHTSTTTTVTFSGPMTGKALYF